MQKRANEITIVRKESLGYYTENVIVVGIIGGGVNSLDFLRVSAPKSYVVLYFLFLFLPWTNQHLFLALYFSRIKWRVACIYTIRLPLYSAESMQTVHMQTCRTSYLGGIRLISPRLDDMR